MWTKACLPGDSTSADRGFAGSEQAVASGAATATVVVFETTSPAFIVTWTQQPRGVSLERVATI